MNYSDLGAIDDWMTLLETQLRTILDRKYIVIIIKKVPCRNDTIHSYLPDFKGFRG